MQAKTALECPCHPSHSSDQQQQKKKKEKTNDNKHWQECRLKGTPIDCCWHLAVLQISMMVPQIKKQNYHVNHLHHSWVCAQRTQVSILQKHLNIHHYCSSMYSNWTEESAHVLTMTNGQMWCDFICVCVHVCVYTYIHVHMYI